MRTAVLLAGVLSGAAVSAVAAPKSHLFDRQTNYEDLVPVGCVDQCHVYVKYVGLCGDVVTPQAGSPCMEICKPEEWAQVVPCAVCIGKLSGLDISDPGYTQPPLGCTDPEAYASMSLEDVPAETAPASASAFPSGSGAIGAVTPVVGVVSAASASDASSATFKLMSSALPAWSSQARASDSASTSLSASASATPTSWAGKAGVSIAVLGSALLFASVF